MPESERNKPLNALRDAVETALSDRAARQRARREANATIQRRLRELVRETSVGPVPDAHDTEDEPSELEGAPGS